MPKYTIFDHNRVTYDLLSFTLVYSDLLAYTVIYCDDDISTSDDDFRMHMSTMSRATPSDLHLLNRHASFSLSFRTDFMAMARIFGGDTLSASIMRITRNAEGCIWTMGLDVK